MSGIGTVFEIVKTTTGYSTTPTVLVSFDGSDGANPIAGLITERAHGGRAKPTCSLTV